MIASGTNGVAYIIMMGGIGINGKELLLLQSKKMAKISGIPEEEIEELTRTNGILYEIAATEKNDSLLVQKLREADPDINENLAAIEKSLQKAGNSNYEVKPLDGLIHLFQTAESGSPYEYEQIAEIIFPDALNLILEWMNELASPGQYQ